VKVLLVAPAKDNSSGLAQFPPIGLGYLATALRRAGYLDVDILDCLAEGLDLDGFSRRLEAERPDVVGITTWSLSVGDVAESLRVTREILPKAVTVIGGPHPSAIGPGVLDDFPLADYAFRGEAEAGLPLLVDLVSGKAGVGPEDIPGLMWKEVAGKGGEEKGVRGSGGDVPENVLRETPQAFVDDLDRLGLPSWDLIRPERYALAGSLIRKGTACIVTTRGCPFPCTFCSAYLTAGRRVRRRSVEDVIREIRLLMDNHGIRRFVVFDENITFHHDHIKGICRAVINEGLDIEFELPNGIRLDTLDMDLLTLMRRAGFSERVAVGIESGSERVLKLMKKGLTKEKIREKVDLLNRAGFRPIGYFILGFPTETRSEMEETVSFAISLRLYRAGFMPFHPLPGTESYRVLVERGELPAGFDFTRLSTDSVPYAPEGLTPGELEGIRKRAVLRFNLRPRVLFDYVRDYNSLRFAMKKFRSIFLVDRRRTAAAA